MSGQPPILLLFDGECNFCSFWVRFLIRRDPQKRFRFAALQSASGRETLRRVRLSVDERTTLILVEGDRHYTKSSAALRIVRQMRGLWPLWSALGVIPAPIRDRIYDWIARNRYRWFGKRDACLTPAPDAKDRFLD